jgi:hypothetical protein
MLRFRAGTTLRPQLARCSTPLRTWAELTPPLGGAGALDTLRFTTVASRRPERLARAPFPPRFALIASIFWSAPLTTPLRGSARVS